MSRSVRGTAAVISLVGAILLAGCADAQDTSSADAAPGVVVSDFFVKATEAMTGDTMSEGAMSEESMSEHGMSDGGMEMGLMTGAFMTLRNNGDTEVSLVGGSSPVAGVVEVHEVVNGLMQPKSGGVSVPAGGEALLEPGADHVMLMDLSGPLAPGDEVEITLEFSDGTTQTIVAPVKLVNAEQEHYHAPGMDK